MELQLQLLLRGGDGAQHGESVHARLDVGGRSVLADQHVGGVGNLVCEKKCAVRT